MLEVRNLSKIYKSKKAEDVKALDNLSLSFNNTGMVFILGKSGSGKSTLLNVLGGLDKFDSGEIIINGKSSNTFKEKDFDSYRNTYLGFIFQEYNILSEFSVYKNIEFAIELQGKKPNKEEIEKILEQVDLKGFGKRKPNELSGGQKQRIAIARALIKNPQIIMADEPTGALDSNTGKQVFDTLKKLSKEKLVIVVSHDREFAETYADRIIELKDGKLLSDTTKRKKDPDKINEGFNLIDNDIIHIEKGHKFSKEEVVKLNEFLKNAQGDIILTSDEKLNENVKRLAKIDDNGKREYFDDTKEGDREVPLHKEELKLIKSRMKFKDSFKMGASGLKTKKIRLFFTIILSAIALTLFGLADTMAAYNVNRSNYDSLSSMDIDYVSINKRHVYAYSDGDFGSSEAKVSEKEFEDLKKNYPDYTFKEINSLDYNLQNEFLAKNIDEKEGYYYDKNLKGITYLTKNEMDKFGLKFVDGTNSKLPSNDNEIVVTTYHYELAQKYGLKVYDDENNESKKEIKEAKDLIGLKIGNKAEYYYEEDVFFTIVGVLDTQEDMSGYEDFKELTNLKMSQQFKYSELMAKRNKGFNNLFIVSKNVFEKSCETESKIVDSYTGNSRADFSITKRDEEGYFNYYSSDTNFATCGDEVVSQGNAIFFNPTKTKLKNDEVLVGIGCSICLTPNAKSFEIFENYYINGTTYNFVLMERQINYRDGVNETNEYGFDSKEEVFKKIREIYAEHYLDDYGYNLPFCLSTGGSLNETNYKVVGFVYDFNNEFEDEKNNYEDASFFKNEKQIPKEILFIYGKYSNVVTKLTGDAGKDKDFIYDFSEYDSIEDVLVLRTEISPMLEEFVEMIKTMARIFLYVGLGFALFSALMLMNFIATSISYKKKEIGILRALGARGKDVYGIFFYESLIIVFINFVIAVGLTIGGVILINGLIGGFGISIKLLTVTLRQVGLLAGVSLLVALIATFLPTFKTSRMKPIDAILDRKTK